MQPNYYLRHYGHNFVGGLLISNFIHKDSALRILSDM